MVVHMRHTRAHTRNRRSHHALGEERSSTCLKCGASHVRHRACPSCGFYKGKEAINVLKKVEKKEKKRKAKENKS